MKLKYTTKWFEYKEHSEELELKEGHEVEFYGKDNGINNPSYGTVLNKDGLLVIEWDDAEDTVLDYSDHCLRILKDVGVVNEL